MKLEFFRHSVELVEKYRRPDQVVQHTFQTNGILLDDDWCAFFKEHNFLVGLSVDGPREIHDTYRVDRRKRGTFDRVMAGWRQLRRHGVDFNILCTVNAANEKHGRTVYRFFRDELGAQWVQFIPIVERATEQTLQIANQGWSAQAGGKRLLYTQTGNLVTERTVGARAIWALSHRCLRGMGTARRGRVYVQLFDVTLEAFFGRHLLCIHAPTCGFGPALEYNGDLYSCDHFVEPRFRLGNIHQTHMLKLVASPAAARIRRREARYLDRPMQELQGEELVQRRCPKDRFALSRDGEPGHNYLCAGLERFFMHTGPTFKAMAQLIQQGRPPAEMMASYAAEDQRRGPYHACTCGSGQKFRFCHGNRKSYEEPDPVDSSATRATGL